jgi:membrane protein YdbS with pleckstrin-like domain
MSTNTNNPVENLGLLVAVACVLAGAFSLHDGTSTPYSSQFQVIGAAALLSVGLVVALLITKSRWQRTVWRYRRHLH